MQSQARIRIAAAVEDVYDYLADQRAGAWAPGTLALELVGGEPGVVGAMYRRVAREGSKEVTYRQSLVESLPEQVLTFHSESEDFTTQATYRYELTAEDDDHTWVVVQADAPVSRLREWLARLGLGADRAVRAHLERLRLELEDGARPS